MVKDFYKQSVEDVCSHLGTDPDKGLSSEEAKKRLEKYGPNELAEKRKRLSGECFFPSLRIF